MRSLISRSKALALGGALAAAAALSTAAPAYAWEQINWAGQQVWAAPWESGQELTFNNQVGLWYTIYFTGQTSNGTPIPGLYSAVTLTLASVSANDKSWTFDYSIANASTNPIKSSLVTEFGFDEDTKLTNATTPKHSEMPTVTGTNNNTTTRVPIKDSRGHITGYKNVTTYDDSTITLSGGDVAQGDTESGTFTINFASATDSFNLLSPFVDYEYGETYGSRYGAYFDCGPGGKTAIGLPLAWVPEPGTWALMLTGFFGLGAMLRVRRQEKGMPAVA